MKQAYEKMTECIRVPTGLNEQVISAAKQGETPQMYRKRPVLWAAVCAVLAIVLMASSIALYPRRESALEDSGSAGNPPLVGTSALVAHAAGIGANGGVLLESVEGQETEKLDGTAQTLILTFADGRQKDGTYLLRMERLGTFINEDGIPLLAPTLTGDPAETVSGLYAVPEESVWLHWPVEGANTVSLSAPYGLRADGTYFHSGIDIPAERRTSVLAAADGKVTEAGYETTKGNYLILDHGNGITTLYAHCEELLVETGVSVSVGEPVARVGATGMATGPHLHFEVRQNGMAQNPVAFFDAALRDTLKME